MLKYYKSKTAKKLAVFFIKNNIFAIALSMHK